MCKLPTALFVLILIGMTFSPLLADARALFSEADYSEKPVLPDKLKDPPGSIIKYYETWPMPYALMQTGNVIASYNCYGQFGYGFGDGMYSQWQDVSFETPAGSDIDYLFAGSIWIGAVVGNDTLVSVGADCWQMTREMWPSGTKYPEPSVTKFTFADNYSYRAAFTDTVTNPNYVSNDPVDHRPHIPLNMEIVNRCHSSLDDTLNNAVIYDMTITNIGVASLSEAYIGFVVDGDAYYSPIGFEGCIDDVAGSIPGENLAYIIDNDGDPVAGSFTAQSPTKIIALKFLASSEAFADTNFNWWVSNGDASRDFGPRRKDTVLYDYGTEGLGTPEGDRSKYNILSFPEWDYDQVMTAGILPDDPVWLYPNQDIAADIANGYDARFLISIGPFELDPGEHLRLMYAMFTADAVHIDPTNLDNLPDNPAAYVGNLNFDNLLLTADRVESYAETLLDPLNPVLGLHFDNNWNNKLAWDDPVFDGVTGYNVYQYDIPRDTTVPYPGVIPPWYKPPEYTLVAELDVNERSYLPTTSFGFVNVAARVGEDIGDMGDPILICNRYPAPEVDYEQFVLEGESVTIEWTYPNPQFTIDHFNIYRFDSTVQFYRYCAYHAHYNVGDVYAPYAPADSFDIDGRMYYYYDSPFTPYTLVNSATDSFVDPAPQDSVTYVITAVDAHGYESEYSQPTIIRVVPPMSKDILVLTNGNYLTQLRVIPDSVTNFYDSVLSGYDYDIFQFRDTTHSANCPSGTITECIEDYLFMKYKLVIIDDQLGDAIASYSSSGLGNMAGLYVENGGRLANFGSYRFLYSSSLSAAPQWYGLPYSSVCLFYGIDSLFIANFAYCNPQSMEELPCSDIITGLKYVQPARSGLPVIYYDTTRLLFEQFGGLYWPETSPPHVVAFNSYDFLPDYLVTPLYRFKSRYPAALIEDEIVGMKSTIIPGSEVYTFGFHLWYMDPDSARLLIDYMMNDDPDYADDGAQYLVDAGINGSYNYNTNPQNALGLPDGMPVSLGYEGWIILGMGSPGLVNNSGPDFRVYDAGFDKQSPQEEQTITVYVSENADGPWTLAGEGSGTCAFDLGSAGVASANYVKIVDNGSGDSLSANPGYDLDAVVKLYPTGIGDGDNALLPDEFTLSQNYPNPFNSRTMIKYWLPGKAHVEIAVYNILGREVKTLVDADLGRGYQTAVWDGTAADGRPVASGVYFYRIKTGDAVQTRKMILLK
ncbi:MAG: T9SS type A sorting domain-containing protein [candidate division Zixibacteria bacterium]|nr:T9SS type A sorting domain-containing protein [candidate division Zixibacteria bacterium]